jgi:CARDB
MRRALLTTALIAMAATPASAGAAPPIASVKLAKCSFTEHEAAFYARMRLVEGAERMALRFTLQERTGEAGFRTVRAPGLRRWRRSKPGVRTFGYRQVVRNLPENATHRMRVDYRWYDADGEELDRQQRRSRACRQFAELPNLVAEVARIRRTSRAGVRRYEIRVANTGRASVTSAPVRVTVDGDVVDTRTLALAPRQTRTLVVFGPACERAVRAEADPDGVIAESSEDDNAHELACD